MEDRFTLTKFSSVLLCLWYPSMTRATYGVISWGFEEGIPFELIANDVQSIVAAPFAFAAVMKGGRVRNWGSYVFGASFARLEDYENITTIVAADRAFVGITTDGTVEAWGSRLQGGELPDHLKRPPYPPIRKVVAGSQEFVAIQEGGKVSHWGFSQGQNLKLFEDVEHRLVNISLIAHTGSAFAAITHKGELVTWGNTLQGALSNEGDIQKGRVRHIYHTDTAFAAIQDNGKVVVWGDPNDGGHLSEDQEAALSANVTYVSSNVRAFAALKKSGEVVTWGDALSGGDSSSVRSQLDSKPVLKVVGTQYAFAALLEGGEVVTWGSAEHGGDSSSVGLKLLSRVVNISSNNYAFVALREKVQRDSPCCEVVSWGDAERGGNSFLVAANLLEGVIEVFSNAEAFVAIKLSGEAVAWGRKSSGGVIPLELLSKLQKRVHSVVSHPNGKAFAALICLPHVLGQECEPCPGDHVWNESKLECEACAAGKVPNPDQTLCRTCPSPGEVPANNKSTCVRCNPDEYALVGYTECHQCATAYEVPDALQSGCIECDIEKGDVPTTTGDKCKKCEGGFYPDEATRKCAQCDMHSYSNPGDRYCSRCEPAWIFTKAVSGDSCDIDVGNMFTVASGLTFFLLVLVISCLQLQKRKLLIRDMKATDQSDIEAMQRVLHRANRTRCLFRRGRELRRDLNKQLRIQEHRYTTFDALEQILNDGHLKMIHASVITNAERLGGRMIRQQDLKRDFREEETFWSGRRFRQQSRMVAAIAISYCWCHPVHPDPKGFHLKILCHAAKLRLAMVGKGHVQDLAVFLDYMSLAQHAETGNKDDPSRGHLRSLDEEKSFKKGLRVVNIPYACQLVETWILAWVPPGVQNKYEDRAWPTFEKLISSLVKDSQNLVRLTDETRKCEDPVVAFNPRSVSRDAPQTPERFNQLIVKKSVTSGADVEFLKTKYLETFRDVIGHGKTLWFANLGWTDAEADDLVAVFRHCDSLETLILSGNSFTGKAAKRLVDAAGKCLTLQSMDLADNEIADREHADIQYIWEKLGKKPSGLHLLSRKMRSDCVIASESFLHDEESRLIEDQDDISFSIPDEMWMHHDFTDYKFTVSESHQFSPGSPAPDHVTRIGCSNLG